MVPEKVEFGFFFCEERVKSKSYVAYVNHN